MQAQPATSPEVLCEVLRRSVSTDDAQRREAEAHIEAVSGVSGLLASLLQLSTEARAEELVRVAAAIQLKNQVRKWWVAEVAGPKGFSQEEKAAVRSRLLEHFVAAYEVNGVRTQLLESFRLIALQDFPERWPGLAEQLLARLRSDDTLQTHCALLVLRRLFKQLEMRPVARRGDVETLCAAALPTLKALAPMMLQVGAAAGPHSERALEMLKLVLKCLYSSVHVAVAVVVKKEIEEWMSLVLAVVAQRPAAGQLPEEEDAREASVWSKCRKWGFHFIFRFVYRHGHRRRALEGCEAFAEAWFASYAPKVTELCMEEACAKHKGSWAPRRCICLALLCLADLSSKEPAYALMRPGLQTLLEAAVYPVVRVSERDLALWQEDPEELIREMYEDSDSYQQPRAAALDFVQKLLLFHGNEVLMPLLDFCRRQLEAQRQAPADPTLAASKDGALRLLGAMGDNLLELEGASSSRKTGKKGKQALAAGVNSVGELLANHVLPDLASPFPFLRMRACWIYEQLAPDAGLGSPAAAESACSQCLRLVGDSELPVRVQAGTCVKGFLRREGDEAMRGVIRANLGPLLERLLRLLGEVQIEELAETLNMIVSEFPQDIAPYALELAQQLASQFCRMADAKERQARSDAGAAEDGVECAAMGSLQTLLSVLQSCTSVGEGDGDAALAQQRQAMFAKLAEVLAPVLAQLLRPSGVDYLEEAAEILGYLLLHGPSPIAPCLWPLFPQLYQTVCGGSTPSLPLSEELKDGWAPDLVVSMAPALGAFFVRGPPQAFMAAAWAEGGKSYPEMMYAVFSKIIRSPGVGAERDAAAVAGLASTLFSAVQAPSMDAAFPHYFEELWRRAAETAELRRSTAVAFSSMLWYNSALFLQCTESTGCSRELFEAWLGNVSLLQRLEDKRLFMLAFIQLLRAAGSGGLPASLSGGLPLIVRELATQSEALIRLRAQAAAGDAEEESDDGGSDDDDEDAGPSCNADLVVALAKASPLAAVDELGLLLALLRQAPPALQQQLDSWLGPGVLPKWVAQLEAAAASPAAR